MSERCNFGAELRIQDEGGAEFLVELNMVEMYQKNSWTVEFNRRFC